MHLEFARTHMFRRAGRAMTDSLPCLLHGGLDAIVQRDVDHMPRAITPQMRMARYVRAASLSCDRFHDLRVMIGTNYKRAWHAGSFPHLAPAALVCRSISTAVEDLMRETLA